MFVFFQNDPIAILGKIVEVNERLVAEPDLVRTHPGTEGFVAMVLPKIPDGLKELRERLECVDEDDQDSSVGKTGEKEGLPAFSDTG